MTAFKTGVHTIEFQTTNQLNLSALPPAYKGTGKDENRIIRPERQKRYVMNVTRQSTGLRRELLNYKWRVTKDGITTNEPVDCFNHAIDAVRYGALARLKIAHKPRGITVRQ